MSSYFQQNISYQMLHIFLNLLPQPIILTVVNVVSTSAVLLAVILVLWTVDSTKIVWSLVA
jgi:hypothetical protein